MKQHEATTKILTVWEAQWPTLSGSIPYVFDNEAANESPSYARLSIRSGLSSNNTLGTSQYKQLRNGVIDVKIYGPADAGRIGVDQLAQHVRTIYERKRLSFAAGDDIVCLETSAREANDPKKPNYWILLVTTRFWFTEQG